MNKNELNLWASGVCQSHPSTLTALGTQTNGLLLNRTSPTCADFIGFNTAPQGYLPLSAASMVNNFIAATCATIHVSNTSPYIDANNLLIGNSGTAVFGWHNTIKGINSSVFTSPNYLSITAATGTESLFKTFDYGIGITSGTATLPTIAGANYMATTINKDYTTALYANPLRNLAFDYRMAATGSTATMPTITGANYMATTINKDYAAALYTNPLSNLAFIGGTRITTEAIVGTRLKSSFDFANYCSSESLRIDAGTNIYGSTRTKLTGTVSSMSLTQPSNIFGSAAMGDYNNSFIVGSQASVLGWFNEKNKNLYPGFTQTSGTIRSNASPVFTAGKELVSLMNQLKENVNVDHFGFNHDTEYSGGNVVINFHFHLTVNNISGTYAHIGNNIYNQRLK